MNKKVVLFGMFGLILLLDRQIWAMNDIENTDGSLNSNLSATNAVESRKIAKQNAKKWKKRKNSYFIELENSNRELIRKVESLIGKVDNLAAMFSKQNCADIGLQPFSENSSKSESYDQDEQVQNAATNTLNPNINPSPDDIGSEEVAFIESCPDCIQLTKVDGSVGAQFRKTQLDATFLFSSNSYSVKIYGINGSDEMPGRVTFNKMTICRVSGHVCDITKQDLSKTLMSIIREFISYNPELEHLRVGLREVGVGI